MCVLLGIETNTIGIPKATQEQTVVQLVHEIDLDEKIKEFSAGLSGGQKRKLSVGIALIGSPRILCLDEVSTINTSDPYRNDYPTSLLLQQPSSGMDPQARRKLWSLLQSKRAGRITLLTTHYMQEADILADRKAILSKGRVQCVGSSLFLKSKFGVGYHLKISKRPNFDEMKMTQLIQQFVPTAQVEEASSTITDVSYALPTSQAKQFPPLFETLSNKRNDLQIGAFGINVTTLEEVFLQLAKREEAEEAEKNQANAELATIESRVSGRNPHFSLLRNTGPVDESRLPLMATDTRVALPTPSFFHRVFGLMSIRWKQARRNWRALWFQVR